MNLMVRMLLISFPLFLCGGLLETVALAEVAVGAAKVDVTPRGPVVLAGYGGRSSEHEGIDTQLWARALVIGETSPVAIVVLDNCGVTDAISKRLASRLAKRGITPERLVVAATHTHNAPSLVGYAPILWAGRTTPEQDRHVQEYTEYAIERMEAAVIAALESREPMRLEWAQGRATFGGNRRVLNTRKWAGFGFQRGAPVDHSLPVLAARDKQGTVRAVWANYACHCTTVGSVNRVGGDWAGYANEYMEKEFPAAISLMTIGCGADVGPQPSGSLQIAEQHGKAIAIEVKRLLGQPNSALPEPTVRSRRIKLPLSKPQPKEYWEEQARRGSGFQAQLAKSVLGQINATGKIATEVEYPIRTWTFGEDLAMVFLAGEVVVDYSVRLNRQLDWTRLWITAWANDMPGYIPSRRVLQEGGYEADFSQVYYAKPARYDPDIEEMLVETVVEMLGERFAASPDQAAAPFHRLPSGEPDAFRRVAAWAASKKSDHEAKTLASIREAVALATPAFGEAPPQGGEQTEWHNFAGDFASRIFIRQQTEEAGLRWRSPPIAEQPSDDVVLCFTGGVGWSSQPETAGFALRIRDKQRLKFDVTQKPSRWGSDDGKVELIYLPTWTSDVDSGGFFFVRIKKDDLGSQRIVDLSVRSLGKGSLRWFAIDTRQEIPRLLKLLAAALER